MCAFIFYEFVSKYWYQIYAFSTRFILHYKHIYLVYVVYYIFKYETTTFTITAPDEELYPFHDIEWMDKLMSDFTEVKWVPTDAC